MNKAGTASFWSIRSVWLSLGLLAATGCSHNPLAGNGDGGANGDGSAIVTDGGVAGDGGAAAGDAATGCSSGTVNAECMNNAQCDDGNPQTVDTCQLMVSGEFPVGTCLHAGCDGGLNCAMQAIDPTCGSMDAGVVYPTFVPLVAPDVPAACANGFQLTDAQATLVYVVQANTTAGSRALTLDLDIATYTAPDGVQITGVDGACKKYTLFDTCHLKTADQAQGRYTDGVHRPDDVAIRQYHLDLRPGTSQLTFDFSRVVSPMYLQVLGLCDFTLPAPPTGSVRWFATVP